MYTWSKHFVCAHAHALFSFTHSEIFMAVLKLSLFGVAPLFHSTIPKITFAKKPILASKNCSYFHYSSD